MNPTGLLLTLTMPDPLIPADPSSPPLASTVDDGERSPAGHQFKGVRQDPHHPLAPGLLAQRKHQNVNLDLPNAWVLHCDGSFQKEQGRAGSGGLLIDPGGVVVAMFQNSWSIEEQPVRGSNHAEWLALQHGLDLAQAVGVPRLDVRMDSLEVVDDVARTLNGVARSHPLSPLRDKNVLPRLYAFEAFAVRWIARHHNKEADLLSRADRLHRVLQRARQTHHDPVQGWLDNPDPAPHRPACWLIDPAQHPLHLSAPGPIRWPRPLERTRMSHGLRQDHWQIAISVADSGAYHRSVWSWALLGPQGERVDGPLHRELGTGNTWLRFKALAEAARALRDRGVRHAVWVTPDEHEVAAWTTDLPRKRTVFCEARMHLGAWLREHLDVKLVQAPLPPGVRGRVQHDLRVFAQEIDPGNPLDAYDHAMMAWRQRQRERGLAHKLDRDGEVFQTIFHPSRCRRP